MTRVIILLAAALGLSFGTAQAQSPTSSTNSAKTSPGTTGAMSNVNKDGIATDPGGVAAQQGAASKASPGTVGAAPGANTHSQVEKK